MILSRVGNDLFHVLMAGLTQMNGAPIRFFGNGPHVIAYLQREIRQGRRNVGALKLSNLLQPDRFEEDLNIHRVRLEPPPRAPSSKAPPPLSTVEQERRRVQALEKLIGAIENSTGAKPSLGQVASSILRIHLERLRRDAG